MNEAICKYCDDTGYIGSPLELNCTPCTDCVIWSDKLERAAEAVQAEGHQSTELPSDSGSRIGGSYE